jgi:hypothetical protein
MALIKNSRGMSSFTKIPEIRAPLIIENRYRKRVFFPIEFPITEIVAAFVAGPAIRKTIAAPGERPFSISTAAIGTDPVAQT